jgi:DNA (cytosine-5)-methyltransferase 1
MNKLRVLDLFSGIGGFSLGLERTGGFETVAFCEIEPFPRKVLAKHWPGVPIYEDVRTLEGTEAGLVDVITGGFPCQDISHAGNQKGIDGETRSSLYREVLRIACNIRPKYIILENVSALLSGPSERPGYWLGTILRDSAQIGYDAEWHSIRAGTIGLPQERNRVWLLAYPNKVRRETPVLEIALTNEAGAFCEWQQVELCGTRSGNARWLPITGNRRVDNGLPSQLDIDRTGAIGNAVVPQVPELIGRAILKSEERNVLAASY